MKIISQSVPFKPNMRSLSKITGISINTLKSYLLLLADAEMISLLYTKNKGLYTLNKPEKIFLNNTNLMYNLSERAVNNGNIRETFFLNQLKPFNKPEASSIADFLVEDHTFEIGEKNKRKRQIKGMEDAWIVKDDIETGAGNTIPLWLFGFLY